MQDDYSSIWVSHSSIKDFLKCPKAYFLHNVYKDPRTRRKITIINPPFALGQAVHEVLDILTKIKAEERLRSPLLQKYEEVWQTISGRKGGFSSQDEEDAYKERGKVMIQRVTQNPGPIANKALRLISPDELPPHFYLSIDHKIILCGKVDWIEYLPETDSVHVIDFKTGKQDEDPGSLQMAIYCLLVQNLKKRKIHKVSYWYLDKYDIPTEMQIPDCDKAREYILDLALKIKTARLTRNFDCPRNGCYACKPYLAIINGEAEFVGTTEYQDVYVVK